MTRSKVCLILVLLMPASALCGQSDMDYPNPKIDFKSCNRPKRSYICDPDGVITEKEANSLDRLAEGMTTDTTCLCKHCQMKNSGVKIGILLKYNLTLPKENVPLTDLSAIAQKIRQQWHFGSCEDDILIFVVAQTKQAQFDIGPTVEQVMSRKLARQVFNECCGHFDNDYFYQGLESMINSYRDVLCRIQWRKPKAPSSKTGIIVGVSLGIAIFITLLVAAALLKCREVRKIRSLQKQHSTKSTETGMFEYQLCEVEEEKNGNGSTSSDEGIDSDDDGKNSETMKLHVPPFSDTFRRQLSAVVEENEDDIEAAAIKFAMVSTPQNSNTHVTEL